MTAFGSWYCFPLGFEKRTSVFLWRFDKRKDTTYRTISFLGTNRVVGVFLNPGLTDRSKNLQWGRVVE